MYRQKITWCFFAPECVIFPDYNGFGGGKPFLFCKRMMGVFVDCFFVERKELNNSVPFNKEWRPVFFVNTRVTPSGLIFSKRTHWFLPGPVGWIHRCFFRNHWKTSYWWVVICGWDGYTSADMKIKLWKSTADLTPCLHTESQRQIWPLVFIDPLSSPDPLSSHRDSESRDIILVIDSAYLYAHQTEKGVTSWWCNPPW